MSDHDLADREGSRLTLRKALPAACILAVALLFVVCLLVKAGDDSRTSVDPGLVQRFEANQAAQAAEQQRVADAALAQVPRPTGRPLRLDFIGDSITAGDFVENPKKTFAYQVATWLRKRAPVTVTQDVTPSLTSIQAARNSAPRGQDVVIVFVGTYEYFGTTKSEFSSAYPQLIANIHRNSPRAQIVCVTPWVSQNEGQAYATTIAKACSDTNVETLVNLSGVSGREGLRVRKGDPFRGGTVPFDGFPNEAGHSAIANAIEKQIQIVK